MPKLTSEQALRYWLNTLLGQQWRRLVVGALLALATALSAMALLGRRAPPTEAAASQGVAP